MRNKSRPWWMTALGYATLVWLIVPGLLLRADLRLALVVVGCVALYALYVYFFLLGQDPQNQNRRAP